MKQNESIFAYVLRLAGTLFLIAAVVAVALAGVNGITAPVIEALNAAKTQAAISAVLASTPRSRITPMPPASSPRSTRAPTATPLRSAPAVLTTPSP